MWRAHSTSRYGWSLSIGWYGQSHSIGRYEQSHSIDRYGPSHSIGGYGLSHSIDRYYMDNVTISVDMDSLTVLVGTCRRTCLIMANCEFFQYNRRVCYFYIHLYTNAISNASKNAGTQLKLFLQYTDSHNNYQHFGRYGQSRSVDGYSTDNLSRISSQY